MNHRNCLQDLNDLLQNNKNTPTVSTTPLYTYGNITDMANAKNFKECETKVATDIFNINDSLLLIYHMMVDMGMSKNGAQSALACLLIEEYSTLEARAKKRLLIDKIINDWHNYMVWKEFNKNDMPFEDTNQISTKCAAFLSNFRVGILQMLPTADADALLDSLTKSCVEVSNTDKMADMIRVGQTTKSQLPTNIIEDTKDRPRNKTNTKVLNKMKLLNQ